ncbi:5687_t:CDS:2, partial [Gigaspora margarita]
KDLALVLLKTTEPLEPEKELKLKFLIKTKLNETLQEAHICYNKDANAILFKSNEQIDLKKT